MTEPNEVPPVPSSGEGGEKLAALQNARHEAVQAVLIAESAEREARNHRRYATRLLKAYERMLFEYKGQMTLPDA